MNKKSGRYILLCWITICVLLSSVCVASAHKVRIFAYGEGDAIAGETAFSGGRGAKNSKIIVMDAASDKVLSSCMTDAKGNFEFPIPEEAKQQQLDLRIVVNVGEGHRGEWLLEAEDYLDVSEPFIAEEEKTAVAVVSPVEKKTGYMEMDEERLRRVVAKVMDKKLASIKHMISKNQDRGTGLQDILGGIGYIIGIAGIVAYMKSRQKKQ